MSPHQNLIYRDPSQPIEKRTADLLARMTLEEKLAQMSIFHMRTNNLPAEAIGLDRETRELMQNGMGALGRPGLHSLPQATAVWTNSIQKFLLEETRLGIPVFFVDEALHGLMASGSTSFPQAIGLASTWDPDLVERVFSVTAREMRARGDNYALTPVLDLARDPRWGRTEETYGEDPYLGSRMGVAAIRGLQGSTDDIGKGAGVSSAKAGSLKPIDPAHVLATAKHFAAHGQPEAGSNAAPANFAERELREFYLTAFQAAVVEAGVGSVMASYNEINGIPVHVNKWLLQTVLREEWGFQGVLTSDGNGITQLETTHHVVASKAEAARRALATGIDFELDDCFHTLLEQVHQGSVPVEWIDQAVQRILAAKFRLGLFDQPYVDPQEAEIRTGSAEARELALEAAQKSLVLLKNDGLLPLPLEKLKTLAVIGPNAAGIHLGGYSAAPKAATSVLDGIRARAGKRVKILYAEGCRITANDFGGEGWRGWYEDAVLAPDPSLDDRLIREAVKVARRAEAVLLVIGENESLCREGWGSTHLGDRDSLDLPGRQEDLVRALVGTGVPLVALLINGRPLSINYLSQNANAIFEGWYLGQEGGSAFADALFGDVNPGGKLPITFPRSAGQIPAFYNHKPSAERGYVLSDKRPLYSFGHGLSYTRFEFKNLQVNPERIPIGQNATVRVDVVNGGTRSGEEVVQMYIRDCVSSVTRPVKELKGFQRIRLQPGEMRTVSFPLGFEQLSFIGEDMQRILEPGSFDIMIGSSSDKVQTVSFHVVG